MKLEIALFLSSIFASSFALGCEHDCGCEPKGTWGGATTVSTSGYSSITYVCSDTAEVTDPRDRRTQCSYVCTARLKEQGVTSDYEMSLGPRAVSCQDDCQANAKLSVSCVQGARVNTLFGWN